MSNSVLDWLEKRKLHRELLARWDALEKQAHAGMVFSIAMATLVAPFAGILGLRIILALGFSNKEC
jgi:hypothetical protein